MEENLHWRFFKIIYVFYYFVRLHHLFQNYLKHQKEEIKFVQLSNIYQIFICLAQKIQVFLKLDNYMSINKKDKIYIYL